MRWRGSSFACAAFGCVRAGLVNHECIGAVMGPGPKRRGAPAAGVASAGVRRDPGVSGIGTRSGGTCVTKKV
jgi:hypothetical protein